MILQSVHLNHSDIHCIASATLRCMPCHVVSIKCTQYLCGVTHHIYVEHCTTVRCMFYRYQKINSTAILLYDQSVIMLYVVSVHLM
jgi:hypothetical protein